MRLSIGLGVASVLFAMGALYGCSSSAPGGEATEEADAGAAVPPLGTGAPSAAPPGTPIGDTADAGAVKEGGGGTGTGGGDGGGTGGGDGGGAAKDGGAANAYCVTGSTAEVEANDTAATATAITGSSFCGTLASTSDVDYGSFVLPASATSFNFNLHLAKSTDVFLNVKGQHVAIAGTNLPFEPGETYTIEVRPKSGQAGQYRVDVSIK